MLGQLFTISRNTFKESIRQPIFVVLIFVAGLLLVLNPSLAAYTMEDDDRLLVDLGLSTLFLIGLLLAAFTATNVLTVELENRTVLTVVSKPVPRPVFMLGKFLGVAAAILIAFWTLSTIFLLTVRHGVMTTNADGFDMPVIAFGSGFALLAVLAATLANYLYRWVFTSTVVGLLAVAMTFAWGLVLVVAPNWSLQNPTTDFYPQIMIGLAIVFEAVLILTAIAIAISTRLSQVMTLVISIGFFLLGLGSDYLGSLLRDRLEDLVDPSIAITITYRAIALLLSLAPNLQFLWPADAINQGHDIPLYHLGTVSAYTACYVVAVLAIAVALFQTRDVG